MNCEISTEVQTIPKVIKDITGNKYGKLTALEPKRVPNGRSGWLCLCVCGGTTTATHHMLVSGNTASCGCSQINQALYVDVQGQFVNEWYVHHRDPDVKNNWVCTCSCGEFRSLTVYSLLGASGSKSCGCKGAVGRVIGKTFGKLTVLGKSWYKDLAGVTYVDCVCECGKTTKVTPSKLTAKTNQRVVSCGCYKYTTGPSHFNYRGILTDQEKLQKRSSYEYRKWRDTTYELDNYSCVVCSATKTKINAHHILSFTYYPDLRYDLNNGVTLCTSCHTVLHDVYGKSTTTKNDIIDLALLFGRLPKLDTYSIGDKMITEKIHDLYSEFIYKRTYSRWLPEEMRRESFRGSIDRYGDFFIPRLPSELVAPFNKALNGIETKDQMPSMRAFWSAGPALAESHIAAYNCAYIAVENVRDFAEMLYVLMHGTGVGFSVERQVVQKLPAVPEVIEEMSEVVVVEDSKLGWAKAFDSIMQGLFNGCSFPLDVSKVRPKGARLKTFGGRASGPEPFQGLVKFVKATFHKAKGRQLNSLEVHDICCKIADCVVVGGVRRSACISFSNLSDQRMKHAKDGQFWLDSPQRALANNSIAYTEKPDGPMFMEEWLNLMRSGSGERGIFNVAAARKKADKHGRRAGAVRGNPCLESLMFSKQYCNLTEVVVKPDDTKETLLEKIDGAVLIGCVQSTLTDFPFISEDWKINCEEERLIGVSLTGVCDCPLFRRVNDPTKKLLAELKAYAHERAAYYAGVLGINVPKQITLVKPSGTVSQLCNCSSGIHPRYSDYYIRRVRVNAKDPIAKLLKNKGVPCNPEVGTTWEDYNTLVFEFPIKSPRGSLQRTDFTALEQLEYWKMFNEYWCDGNPSVTIYVKEDEWVEVGAWVYKNWDDVCGLSFLPFDGGNYPLAPYEEINKEQYYSLCKLYNKVSIDFDTELSEYELEDETIGSQELACAGGTCELR